MAGREEIFKQAMEQGHSAAWEQQWKQAATFYRQALDEFPDRPNALISLGLALYETGEYKEALKWYLKAVQISPDDPLPVEKAAQLFSLLEEPQRAVHAAARAAELYLKKRDVGKSIENWINVTQLDPTNRQARARLGMIYERLENRAFAVSEYMWLSRIYQQAGERENAGRTIAHALELLPDSTDALNALAALRKGQAIPTPDTPPAMQPKVSVSGQRRPEQPKQDAMGGLDPVAETQQRALSELARLLFDSGDEEKTVRSTRQEFDAIVEGAGGFLPKQVDHTRILLFLSQVVDLQIKGDYPQAVTELKRALDVGLEHPAAYYDLGYLLVETGQVEEAVLYLQKALRHPDFALGARLLIGQELAKLEQWADAAGSYLEALRLADAQTVSPEQADALSQLYEPLIEAHMRAEDTQIHQRVCENVADLLGHSDWRNRLTQARKRQPARSNGGPPTPLAELIIEARSSHIVEALTRIHQYESAGLMRTAMEESFYALQYAPTYLPLHATMGELLVKMEQAPEAIAKFLMVAKSYGVRGEAARSVDYLRRVVDLAPLDTQPRNRLIDQLLALGETEAALDEYLDFADVYYNLADLDNARQTCADALRLAQRSNASVDWQVKIMHRMADIDLQSLSWRQAVRIFEKICNLKPDDIQARQRLIGLQFRMGQQTKALAEVDELLKFLADRGLQLDAIAFMEQLVADEPQHPSLRSRLAQLYKEAGRVTDAVAQLDVLGDLLLDAGDKRGAERVIKAILALKPPNTAEYQRLLEQINNPPAG